MGGFPSSSFFTKNRVKDCSALTIKTQLFSPISSVLQKLSQGEKMSIILLSETGPCVATHKNSIAGTIITKELPQLISCMKAGFEFNAEIRYVSGGECAVTIICAGKVKQK